jgi:hypothetical protein
MGRLEVQGVVSAQTGEPLVQFRQLDDNDKIEAQWQTGVAEAREMAQQVLEATFNATYDAALIAWAKEGDNLDMGVQLVDLIRRFRADTWGLPDRPEDWRP